MVSTPSGAVEYTRFLGAYLIPTAVMGTPSVAFPAGVDDQGLADFLRRSSQDSGHGTQGYEPQTRLVPPAEAQAF